MLASLPQGLSLSLDAPHCWLALTDPTGNLYLAQGVGAWTGWKGRSLADHGGMTSRVWHRQTMLRSTGPQEDPWRVGGEPPGLGPALAAPLICGSLCLGVLGAARDTDRPFDTPAVALLKQLGTLASQLWESHLEAHQGLEENLELHRRLERMELALWGSDLGLWDWDLTTDQVYRSDDWCRMFGQSDQPTRFDLKGWRELVHPEDRDAATRVIEEFRQGGQDTYQAEFRMLCRDGGWHWVRETGKATDFTPHGKPTRAVGTVADIDPRRRAIQTLSERERQLRTLVTNLPGVAYRNQASPSWTFEYLSPGSQALLGWNPADSQQRPDRGFFQRIHPVELPQVRYQVEQALAARRPFQISYTLHPDLARDRWIWEKGVGVYGAKGHLEAVEGIMLDATEHHRAERDRVLRAKLEASIATAGAACHELNQPLQSLLSGLELMVMRTTPESPASREANRLASLVQQLAEITQRLNRITDYTTKGYVGRTQILDLDRASVRGTNRD